MWGTAGECFAYRPCRRAVGRRLVSRRLKPPLGWEALQGLLSRCRAGTPVPAAGAGEVLQDLLAEWWLVGVDGCRPRSRRPASRPAPPRLVRSPPAPRARDSAAPAAPARGGTPRR